MKLLVVSSWFPYPPDNGSKIRAFSLLRELSARYEVTLLSFSESADLGVPEELGKLCSAVRVVAGNPFTPRKPLSKAAFFSVLPRSYAQTYSHSMQRLVDDYLEQQDAAIGLQIGAALYLRGRPFRPRVFEEAEVGVILEQFDSQTTLSRRLRYGATWLKYSKLVRSLVDELEHTTVVSEVERGHLRRAGCDLTKVTVLPNGTDIPECAWSIEPTPATLIYPGSITYSANLDAVQYFLSEIWPIIRRAVPEATLIVTGSTDGVTVEDLPNRSGVTFTGHVAGVADLIRRSTVCIVPLRLGGGTRLKVLEAMALGTPVVSTPKGIEGLAVTPGKDVMVGGTSEQFIQHVLRVLHDQALREQFSANGRMLVQSLYDWTVIGHQLERVLQDVMGSFRGPA